MAARVAVIGVCALLPLMAACSKRESYPNQPLRQRGVIIAPEPPQPAGEAPIPQLPPDPSQNPTEPAQEQLQPQTVSAEEAKPDAPADKPPRNLRQELETMMGSPVSCLAARPANAAPNRVDISLSASVMPSGAVGRAEVSAPGLNPEEVACLRARLETLRFAQPIENAPFTVNGSITLNRGS